MGSLSKAQRESKRFPFTDQRIERLEPPESGRASYYDAKAPELGLRVDANGRKSYFWFRTMAGQPVFRALGEWPSTDIETARDAARELTGKQSKWRRESYETPNPFYRGDADLTFGKMFDQYHAQHTARHAANPEKAKRSDEWMLDKYLPGFRERKARSIHSREVKALHAELSEEHGPVSADRVCQMLRRVYAWAIRQELYTGQNPALGVDFNGNARRERFLQPAELPKFFAELRADKDIDLQDSVLLALFTGARRGDVYSMRWADLDLDAAVWRTYASKDHLNYSVPLTAECVEILKRRAANAEPDAVWVFPSYGKSGHLLELRKPWNEFRSRAGLGDFHFHDLRRTLGSYEAANGASLAVIGKSLGHAAGSSATAVYARLHLEPVKAAVAQAASTITTLAAKKPEAQPELVPPVQVAEKPARKRLRA